MSWGTGELGRVRQASDDAPSLLTHGRAMISTLPMAPRLSQGSVRHRKLNTLRI